MPDQSSVLSFLPKGIIRSLGEYLVAIIPGSFLLLAFFIAAEGAVFFIEEDLVVVSFIPVICLLPILAGAVSTLVLEKLRKKPLSFQRGALVGALSCLAGSFISALLLVLIFLFADTLPLGSYVEGILVYVALLAIIAVDTILGALGGVLVVKFVKDI